MLNKFVIYDGSVIMGQAQRHADLIKQKSFVHKGGGFWVEVPEKNAIVFYGKSAELGRAQPEDITQAVKTGRLNLLYSNCNFFCSHFNDTNLAIEDFKNNPKRVFTRK